MKIHSRFRICHLLAGILCIVVQFGSILTRAAESKADVFADGTVLNITIELDTSAVASLRKEPRTAVHATVREGSQVFEKVSLHLKGSIGSFRSIDEKPAMTLDFNRFNPGQKFHGLRKIHLNNSVEDPSFLNEQLGGEVFRAAGIPAPRVTHAHVALNSRDLGLFVLIEGFTEDLLRARSQVVGPDLFEPKDGRDIEAGMKRNSVITDLPKNDGILGRLAEAAREPDLNKRWTRLQEVLDVDQFVTFMALEVILCHRDGYSIARNNFRIYHDPKTWKMVFLPHGMDQLFGNPDFPWEPTMSGTVAQAVMQIPQGRARYEQLFPQLITNYFAPLTNRATQLAQRLRPAVTENEYRSINREAALSIERISARCRSLEEQMANSHGRTLQFTNGVALVGSWTSADQPTRGKMEITDLPDKVRALHIVAASPTSASWRSKWTLGHGRYQFEAKAKVGKFKSLAYGTHQGVGIRTTGNDRQSPDLVKDSDWTMLRADFQVDAPVGEVELICEFRASAGEAWFDMKSMKVRQIE